MTEGLTVASGAPSHPYLVFTSAGDRASLERWLKGSRNFDLWITYYGDAGTRFQELATYYNRRKGSKFQNLHYAYNAWPGLLARYSAIMVMDDDVHITASGISRLFEVREELDLWVLQPAFSPRGKISYPMTQVDRSARVRYLNFVEETCPLFRRDKLDAFLATYDPVLVGYGIDWWFLHTMGDDLRGKVALVDEVSCVNPTDDTKGGQREIDRLLPRAERVAIWTRIKAQHGIRNQDEGLVEYSRIPRGPLGRLHGHVMDHRERLGMWLHSIRRRAARKALKIWRTRPPLFRKPS